MVIYWQEAYMDHLIYHLILLYQAENMPREAEQAKYEREKFINARDISREASRIKGYNYKNSGGR